MDSYKDMHSAKQTMKDTASATKEHVDNYQAKVEEKVEKSRARTEEEKQIGEEKRKAKEAEEEVNLHQDKAEHVVEELDGKNSEYFPAAYPPSGTGYRDSHHF